MKKQGIIRIWLRQIRAPFLVLSFVLVLIGTAAAARDGFFNAISALLLFAGVLLAHVSANLFNELSDYRTGIDENTTRTPYSGGSGMMQAGETRPGAVAAAAYVALAVSAGIGVYFCLTGSVYILFFMLTGVIAVRFYTTHLARFLVGEFFCGLTLGTMVVLGTYMSLTGGLNGSVIIISLPPGILTALLLLLNEFPDEEADRMGGRRHLVIQLGRKKCAVIYICGLMTAYCIIALSPLFWSVTPAVLIALITLPLGLKISRIVLKEHGNLPRLVPALGLNAVLVLTTDFLLAASYFL